MPAASSYKQACNTCLSYQSQRQREGYATVFMAVKCRDGAEKHHYLLTYSPLLIVERDFYLHRVFCERSIVFLLSPPTRHGRECCSTDQLHQEGVEAF